MAKAKSGLIEKIVISHEDGAYIELSLEELAVLKKILDNVGGSPKTSARGISDRIREAILSLQVNNNFYCRLEVNGSIYFEDYK